MVAFFILFGPVSGLGCGFDLCGGSCMCADERDEMARADSDRFTAIIQQVDCLHELGKDRLSVACERLFFFFFHFRKQVC